MVSVPLFRVLDLSAPLRLCGALDNRGVPVIHLPGASKSNNTREHRITPRQTTLHIEPPAAGVATALLAWEVSRVIAPFTFRLLLLDNKVDSNTDLGPIWHVFIAYLWITPTRGYDVLPFVLPQSCAVHALCSLFSSVHPHKTLPRSPCCSFDSHCPYIRTHLVLARASEQISHHVVARPRQGGLERRTCSRIYLEHGFVLWNLDPLVLLCQPDLQPYPCPVCRKLGHEPSELWDRAGCVLTAAVCALNSPPPTTSQSCRSINTQEAQTQEGGIGQISAPGRCD